MKSRMLALLLFFVMLSGCTRAIVATYEPNAKVENNSIVGKKLAVYQFEDDRAWIDSENDESRSFVGKQGCWKFGLEYEGSKYQPVSSVIQDVFIKEFKAIGIDAFKGEESQSPGYTLKGKILNFEFENETGVFTITSRRHVSLTLTLSDEEGNDIMANELFNEVSRENEGMGVMHSTNVDKLMNQALRKVVQSVVSRINTEMASLGVETISITLNGSNITHQLACTFPKY